MVGDGLHLGRVGTAGVEEGAAGAVDGTGDEAVEGQDVAALAFVVVEVEVGQALPAAADADDFGFDFGGAVGDFLDHRVETGTSPPPVRIAIRLAMGTPGEVAEKVRFTVYPFRARRAADGRRAERPVTREGKEKSFQDQRVAQNGGAPGLTGGDSLLVRGASKKMIEKQNRKREGSGKRVLNPHLGGVQKASRTDESKNDKKAGAGSKSRDGKKSSAGAERKQSAKTAGSEKKKSGGKQTKQASRKTKEQEIPKAPEEVTKVAEEAKPSVTATPERQRQANNAGSSPGPGAEGSRKRTRTNNDGDGADGKRA